MFPKTGRNLHSGGEDLVFAVVLAEALKEELGRSHQAVKTAIRWTGASERSVKHWLAGTHAPRGRHLLALMRHSDGVLRCVLTAAGRSDTLVAMEVQAIRWKLLELLALMEPSQVAERRNELMT